MVELKYKELTKMVFESSDRSVQITRSSLILIMIFAIGLTGIGCDGTPSQDPQFSIEKEEWVTKPKNEWPQIVLTNEASFVGHTPLEGASSFLIKTNGNQVFAATAAHLIGEAGGVEPPIPISQLSQKIRSWKMFPRTMPNDSIEADSIAVQGLDKENLDWLILSIKDTLNLPSYPLIIRKNPVQVGEQVYLIGCPYCEPTAKQNVYVGKVTERLYGDRFRFDITPPVDIHGFSGAPIVDKNGHLVGVMTVSFNPRMSGDKFLEAGGEDIASIYDLLETNH